MTTNRIMYRFAKAGINLSPEAYDIICEKYDKQKFKEEYLDMVIATAIYYRKVNKEDKKPGATKEEALLWVK